MAIRQMHVLAVAVVHVWQCWLQYCLMLSCCPAPLPDSSQRRPRHSSGSTSDILPFPRWVTGELPAADVYHHVLEAATG